MAILAVFALPHKFRWRRMLSLQQVVDTVCIPGVTHP